MRHLVALGKFFIVLAALLILQSGGGPAQGQSTLLAIDLATGDNSSTGVGAVEPCLAVASGQADIVVDAVVTDIADAAAGQMSLGFSGAVTNRDASQSLLNNESPDMGSSAVIDGGASDGVPDTTSPHFVLISNDAAFGSGGASGSGIFIRFVMDAPVVSQPTLVPLTLSNTVLLDPNAGEISHSIQHGTLAVGGATCQAFLPDLSVTMTDDPDPLDTAFGTTVNYAITASNSGDTGAAGVVVRDTLAPGFSPLPPLPAGCSQTGALEVTCGLGSIAPGGTGSVTISATAPSVPVGQLIKANNTAVVDPDGAIVEQSEGNNSFTEETVVLGPPPSCSVQLTCNYISTIDDAAYDDINVLPTSDDCAVGEYCKIRGTVTVDRAGGTPPGVPGDPLLPSVRITQTPAMAIVSDAAVPDGAPVGRVDVTIRSDLDFLEACLADISIVFNMMDGHVDDGNPATPDTDPSPNALGSPFIWPSRLDELRATIESDTAGTETLVARYVGVSNVAGTIIPLQLMVWKLDPNVQHIPGEAMGGWLTVSATADPTTPFVGPDFCTPFQAIGFVLGRTPTGQTITRCLAQGLHQTVTAVDPLTVRPGDSATNADSVNCSAHDVKIVKVGRGSPSVRISAQGGTATRALTVVTANQDAHAETIKTLVTVAAPPGCSASGPGPEGVFSDTSSYGVGGTPAGKKTFTFDVTLTCAQPYPIGQAFAIVANADHRGDDLPSAPDNDDISPTNNTIVNLLKIK